LRLDTGTQNNAPTPVPLTDTPVRYQYSDAVSTLPWPLYPKP